MEHGNLKATALGPRGAGGLSPTFWAICAASTVSWLGDFIQQIGLIWLSLKLTGSAAGVAGTLLFAMVPAAILTPLAGPLIDRYDRRAVLVLCDVLRGAMVCSIALAVSMGQLFAIAALVSVLGSLSSPAKRALIADAVPADRLVRANSLLSATRVACRIVGPAAAGYIIQALGAGAAFLINGASFFSSGAIIWLGARVSAASRPVPSQGAKAFGRELGSGLARVRAIPGVGGLLVTMALVSTAFGTSNVLLWVHAEQNLGAGPRELGFLTSALAAGMLVGSAIVGRGGPRLGGVYPMLAASTSVCGAGLILFAAAPGIAVAALSRVVLGMGAAGYDISLRSYLQAIAPAEFRGRILSVFEGMDYLVSAGAMALVGAAWDLLGIKPLLFGGGGLLLLSPLALAAGWRRSHADGAGGEGRMPRRGAGSPGRR
ncbi:MAG: MFS transporter [Acetobacteraceae bacterium]|nr:MFS transporter [Acetobacteraceae bacterium]